MKKRICFATTIPATLKVFVLPLAQYLHDTGEFEITFLCNEDAAFAASLPPYIRYIPVKMERGISLGGVAAMPRMVQIFCREK